jgi:hypothetical protein
VASDERPLASYALLTSTFAALVGTSAATIARRRGFPERIGAGDVVLLGVATHKVSRLLTKDRVTAFVRAPFTRHQEDSGQGEVEEEPRGEGLQKAIGELLVCPYCIGQWVAAGFATSFALAPRATRWVAALYAIETTSDVLQLAYSAAEDHA